MLGIESYAGDASTYCMATQNKGDDDDNENEQHTAY